MDIPACGWSLHEGECLGPMRAMPAGSVDCLITDPPYGTTKCEWDQVATGPAWWAEALRIVPEHGAIVLFACGTFTADLLWAKRELYRYKWVWQRGRRVAGVLDANRRPLRAHEDILVFGRVVPKYFPVKLAGKPMLLKPSGPGKLYAPASGTSATRYVCDRHPSDVVTIDPPPTVGANRRVHPTQKPVELLSLLVRSYCPEGGIVLDPFAGSGTTGEAALLHGRRVILCERDAGFCTHIRARMASATPATTGPARGVDDVLGGRLF